MEQLIDCRPGNTVNTTNDMFDYLNKERQYPTHCVGCGAKLPMYRKPGAISTCDTVCIIQPPQRSKDKRPGNQLMNLVESMKKLTGVNHATIQD